ncbi:MAG: response regulator [Acidobacteriota bacterium]
MHKTVLIAEDHPDIRFMTKFMVESFGYEVIEARDGSEAFDEARLGHPDLILMDVAMPIMNGITSARLIRATEECANVPIVAVTAYGRDYIDDAGAYGFDEVVSKPVVIEEMRELCVKYLGPEH